MALPSLKRMALEEEPWLLDLLVDLVIEPMHVLLGEWPRLLGLVASGPGQLCVYARNDKEIICVSLAKE